MPKARFESIYADLKDSIQSGSYAYQSFLPSENELTAVYGCSRNTVRRALRILADEGYVQPLHGRGVRVIWQPCPRAVPNRLDNLRSFNEHARVCHKEPNTEVREFERLACTKELADFTGFAVGDDVFRIVRTRSLDGMACRIDRDYLLANVIPDLTPAIAANSIYEYLENDLGMSILTSKRLVTIELADSDDMAWLDLDPYNCVAVVTSQSFNSDGVLFQYTQSRCHPGVFRYSSIAHRQD